MICIDENMSRENLCLSLTNCYSRKFISQNISKMAIRESLSREIAKIQLETSPKFISRKFLSQKFLRLKY